MITNARPMACGNCGRGLFRMFKTNKDVGYHLVAECTGCNSTTIIRPQPAELDMDFGPNSDGRLCDMEPKDLP